MTDHLLLAVPALPRMRKAVRPSILARPHNKTRLTNEGTVCCGCLPVTCKDPASNQVDPSITSNTKPPIPYYDFQSQRWEDARSDTLRLVQLIYLSPSEELLGPSGSYRWDIQASPDRDYNTTPYSQIIVPSPTSQELSTQSPNLIYERHSHKCVIWIEWYDPRITVSNLPRICFFPAG